jgi:hypothetical protein
MLSINHHLAELVEDLRAVAGYLDSAVALSEATDNLLVLRRAITQLQAAADAAAFAGAELGNTAAIHNAFACAKELAVLSVQLDWYEEYSGQDAA